VVAFSARIEPSVHITLAVIPGLATSHSELTAQWCAREKMRDSSCHYWVCFDEVGQGEVFGKLGRLGLRCM
jgi:hypothetical protein